MKNIILKISLFTLVIMVLTSSKGFAQDNMSTMTIKSSTVCEMCKDMIERNLIFEKGVKEVKVDLATKTVEVKYRNDKTTPAKIKAALVKLGYRADDIPADKAAHKKLPECCKKEGCGQD